MRSFLKKCVFLLVLASPVFSQEEGESGLSIDVPIWRQALGGSVLSLPHLQAQSAVVALDGGNIKAYSNSGTPMWNYSARGRISPYVTRSREGSSYFSRTNGVFIAVNRSGRELWRRNLGVPLCANVVTGWDGRLFVPVDQKIFCYTASGNLLWTRTFESSFSVAPKQDRDGGIIFALENNDVYRIDPFGNTHVWTLQVTPAVLLSIERRRVLVLYRDGSMETLNVTAQQSEENSLPKLPAAPLAAANRGNNAAVVLNDGKIVLVSLEEKEILWDNDSHMREFSRSGGKPETEVEMFFDERGVYVLSRDGASGFTVDGIRLWYTILQNAAAIPAFGDDGVLYSGGKDWILYAYKIEDRAAPRGLYGPAPEGSYGMGRPNSSYIPDIPLNENEIKNKLEQINSAVNAGNVGANEPAWTTFLLNIAASNEESIQNRISALRLLGQTGSRETIPWLVNIFRRENEPMIKAAAASAIGAVGVDSEGSAIQTFLYSIIMAGGIRDEQVLLAITSATGALCRFSGPPLSETGVRILNLLTETSYPAIVRRQANRELASLK